MKVVLYDGSNLGPWIITDPEYCNWTNMWAYQYTDILR